jgi:addiction module HigA family antidote
MMKNPPHPGLSVKHDCLDPLGLTVTAAAKLLGVPRETLNDLIHTRRGWSRTRCGAVGGRDR